MEMPIIPLQSLIDSMLFRLATFTWVELVDLLLVSVALYLLLRLMQRSRAALLLRGVLVLSGVLFIITIILPLPAFDWLVRGALIAVLIATPIIFQPELRRVLERIGRHTGITWEVRQTTVEQVLPRVVRAVERLSDSHTGALIALEGNTSLQDVAETGIFVGGQVSSELLQAIFYPSNPLHDGAVIIREDVVVAAGCVLPLSQRPLYFRRRLGTRHRAALGLSESTDALVVVVSEETGVISVARAGDLLRPLDAASLRKHLLEFYTPVAEQRPSYSGWDLFKQAGRYLWQRPPLPTFRQLVSNIGLLFLSLLLALATWSFVIQETNPARRVRLENIPLQVNNLPPDTVLATPLPGTVAAIVQTTDKLLPTLGSRSFQAMASLEGLGPGRHSVAINVQADTPLVRVLSVDPETLDVELVPIISRTLEVNVNLTDRESLSRAYQVVGTPGVAPDRVEILGPEPVVNRVSRVQASLSLANASTSLRETRPVQALDENGREITGLTIRPAAVEVSVAILRRVNARDVGVRVVTQGTPAPGYWLSSIKVFPTTVTLQGSPDQLDKIGGYVDTLPVDVTNTAGNVSLQIPLDLPAGIQAVDSNGNAANTVTVELQIPARRGNLAVIRPVKAIGINGSKTKVAVEPATVRLILSGPLPTLNEIEADPDLVQVLVGVAGLEAGRDNEVSPTIIAPDDVTAQAVPPVVVVTLAPVEEIFER